LVSRGGSLSESAEDIRAVNHLSDELLRSHGELLAHKNIHRKQQLIQVIKLDLDKLAHALIEVKDNGAMPVLRRFFEHSAMDPTAIRGRLSSDRIYHVGFEIHEPLDLVLFGIRHWIEKSTWALGAHMRIKEYLRFPASEAFQTRVGAYAEIMRIWLEVDGRILMLELFDIQRPADAMLAGAPRLTHRNFHGLFRQHDPDTEHRERLARLFEPDRIWHYALNVRQPSDVVALQEELQTLAAHDSNYSLPYKAPVHNPHDGSFHTKAVRRREADSHLEIEFVTHYEQ
jgi:hypothetical protein